MRTLLGDVEQRTVLVDDAGGRDEASASAPFVYFDAATYIGLSSDGVASVTLEGLRHLTGAHGAPAKDFVVTAHLRMGLHALRTLREALEKIEALAAKPADGHAN